jgi:hypothetical protein
MSTDECGQHQKKSRLHIHSVWKKIDISLDPALLMKCGLGD